MVIPLTIEEQKQMNYFYPTKKMGLYIGFNNYENVELKLDGIHYSIKKIQNIEQGVSDF